MLIVLSVCLVSAQTGSFSVNGQLRDYILYVPSGISRPPLVINMHGLGSNASQQRAYTQFDRLADRDKFIVVYPNAINGSWDLAGNTDVLFLTALMDTLEKKHGIDRNRVYATGMSMGGYMSHKLGCQLSGRIAALVSVTGLNAHNALCTPSRPVPVMQIHGTADSVVRYSGVPATVSGWVTRNGCPQNPVTTDPYPINLPTSKVRKDVYSPCNQGSEVVLLTVRDAGHIWPGGLGTTADINASEEVWAFLKRFSLATTGSKEGRRKPGITAPTGHPNVRAGPGPLTIADPSGRICARPQGPKHLYKTGVFIVTDGDHERRIVSRILRIQI